MDYNNSVIVAGQIISEFTFSHTVFGEKFYLFDIAVQRLSTSFDIIPVIISERIIDTNDNYIDMYVVINGQFRSFNRHDEDGSHLILSVFAQDVELYSSPTPDDFPTLENQVFLDGFVCKPPIYRKTPLGREIADVLLAVNRPYGKSDYIPCICWGRNARFAEGFQVGEHIQIRGRIQSREYVKNNEVKIAYEVSVAKLDKVEELGAA